MNILKIGLVAAVLWQYSSGYAGIEAEDNELPPPAVKQLCEEIIASGNSVLEYLNGGTPGAVTNTFGIGSNGWYAFKDVNRILEDIVVHPCILPFLKYRYDDGNIMEVELSCDEDVAETLCQKAVALSPSATHINIPMKKLPYPTPKTWENNLKSLSAPGLKHVHQKAFSNGAFFGSGYQFQSIDLPSAISIWQEAFAECYDLTSLKLSNDLKFISMFGFFNCNILAINIPPFTHSISVGAFARMDDSIKKVPILSVSDLLPVKGSFLMSYPVTLNVTCYSRKNNLPKILDRINSSSAFYCLKNLNIKIADSIKHIVNVDYINGILAMNKGSWNLWNYMVSNNGRALLDISNTEIPEHDLCTIEQTGDVPWVLLFPHITTVDSAFNSLFRQLHGAILFDVGSIADGAFEGCSGLTLELLDTVVLTGTPFAGLGQSILELTVTQPQNMHRFLGELVGAGLDLPSNEKFIIKFSDEAAQDANLGPYVTSSLAVLPPPSNFSGNSALSSISCTVYFDLSNSNISNISTLSINELPRDYSCVFILPDESRHFLQSNNETILNVDVIGEKALIKSAILSENLQEIPEQAFFNSQLTSVTIPSSVTTIGYRAFSYSQLTSVVIPNSVTTIGNNAFANTQLTSVTIPNSVTTIGNYAFSGTRLTSVVIPDSVTTIGNNVFSGCSQLTSVTIHNSVTIGIYSFFSAPIQLIKINCNNPGNNNIVKVLTHVTSYSDVHAIQIALSPSLLESFETDTNLKDYVQEILRIEDFNGYGIIYALQYYSAIFELDLSNTDLVQADINEMTKTLPWRVIFKNGQVDYAITPQ